MRRDALLRHRPPTLMVAFAAVALAAAVLATAASAAPGHDPACLRGVNLSGAEDGALPGRAGFDYIYPTAGEFRRMASLGFTAIRLPVRWERLQPLPDAPLSDAETGLLDGALDAARTAKLAVILDVHNYGYHGQDRLATPALPGTALADLWGRLAARYRTRADVVFSLMNEPHDIPGPDWAATATAAIAAIRAAGARNLVLVPGTAWDGAHSWTSDLPTGNNGRDMLAVRDPLDRFAFDVHQYLDADFSGRSGSCPAADRAVAAVDAVHGWLAANGRRGFLGEFASSAAHACMAALAALVERVDADPKAWVGWTAWAAGPWWPRDYPFSLQPTATGEPPQLALLARLAEAGPPCRRTGSP